MADLDDCDDTIRPHSRPAPSGWQHAPNPAAAEAEAQARLDQLALTRRYRDDLTARKEAERQEVLRQVQEALDAIEAKYANDLADAERAVVELEAEVKADILRLGHSVKHEAVQAVFCRGRTTWDTKGLEAFAEANPAVQQFRKTGNPTVQLRYRGTHPGGD